MFQQPIFGVNLAERQDQADDFFSLVKSVLRDKLGFLDLVR